MLESGYFDSDIIGFDEEGMPIFDRGESSDFLAMFISKIITSGVLAEPGDCFQVVAGEGMKLKVRPGFGIVRGRFAFDNAEFEVTVPTAPTVNRRIDRVILRANYLQRYCEIIVREGTPGTSPVPPELLRPEPGDYYELGLATVAVNSNQTVITQTNITDTRYDSQVCGVVTQAIDHLDTSVFFAQLNQFYEEFVERSDGSYDKFVADMGAYLEALAVSGDSRLDKIVGDLTEFETLTEQQVLDWFETVQGIINEDAAMKFSQDITALQAGKVDKAGDTMSGNLSVSGTVTAESFVGNATSATKLKTARLINGMSFDGSRAVNNYGVCNTAGNVAEKVVECPYFVLTTGAEITVKFTIANTAANPTLNVNRSGAKEIYYRGSKLPGGSHANSQRAFRTNGIRTFRYTGEHYELVGDLDADTTYALATTSANGLMSKEDKAKLDGMPKNFESIIASSQHENPSVQWMEFCDIVIVSAPANQPIEFEFTSKYMAGIGKLSLYFNNAISADATTVNAFYKNQYVPDAFLFNRGGGMWSMYVKRVANDEQTSAFKIKIGDYEKEKVVVTMYLVPNDASSIPENKRIYATIPYATGVKGNAESAYRTGNVNLTANNIGALPITGNDNDGPTSMTGNINLGKSSMDNSPRIQWRDKNRYVWAGTENSAGSWYLWDSTNNRSIITSDINGLGNVYAGTDAILVTDGEGGNLRLFSPNHHVWSEIDCFNDKVARWYAQDNVNKTIPCVIKQSIENQEIEISALKNIKLVAGVNFGVRVIDQSGGWGLISAADFNVASSRRYKENIQPMTDEKAKTILDVEIVTFDYKDGVVGKNSFDRSGVIAEDVAEIIPEAVGYITEDDKEIPDSVDYSKFVPYLIKMTQMQQGEIDQLQAESAALTERLAAIEERLGMNI